MVKLIKFSQPTCNDCRRVDAFLNGNEIEVNEVYDPFESPELAGKYDIGSIPVLIVLDDEGEEIQRSIGFKPDELQEIADLL